jgi:GNAT superfamily N-acetyltransferase
VVDDVSEVIEVGGRRFRLARAARADLPALVDLLRDDPLGAVREGTDLAPYDAAFTAVDRDPAHLLVCVRDEVGRVAATLQLTWVPGLTRGGATRLQVEGVRVAEHARGAGLGTALLDWAHDIGRRRGARLAQLTSDRTRTEAHRFYQGLGYRPTHTGFKREL